MTIQLTSLSNFISPFWFNKMRHGVHLTAVAEDGFIELKGEKFRFADSAQALAAGTPVRVWLNRWWECESVADHEQRKRIREAAQQATAEKERIQLNQQREKAQAINAAITLPIVWEPAIKDVLSGLSASSWGDGRNKATVQHIRLLAPLQAGRMKRQEGDFLCTAQSGSNGKAWTGQQKCRFHDGDGQAYDAPITCKKCLELAEKIKLR